jgi:thiol:disulfide interchange protein DsbD
VGRNLVQVKLIMNSTVRLTLLCAATLFLLGLPATSSTKQNPKDSEIVQVEAYASHESIHPEGSFRIAIVADIKPGFHINSHNPTDQFLVPTVVRFDEEEGITLSPVSYPVPELKSFSFSTSKASVYDGKISIFSQGRLSNDIPPGDVKVSGILAYQACNDQTCFMPRSVDFEIRLKVVNTDDPIKLINKYIFEQKASTPTLLSPSKGEGLSRDELHAKQVIEKGLIYAVIAFFLFGLALNLTPCVYPVIPITVSFFGAQSERKKMRTFVLALYYVAGIAIVFSILGSISALAGRQWGFLFQSPWFVIFVTIIILSMAASMFGAFEITVPSSLMTYAGKSRQGAIGSFVMGLTVGVIIAPCAAGIIIGLVGIVAKLGMVVKGTLLFFVMGLGLGVPYIFLAVSSGLLSRLPKSGVWMVWIRKLFGVLLIGVALYFLVPQAKQASDQQGFYLGVLGIFGGLLLGFLEHGEGYSRAFKIIRAIFGCLLILAGVFLVDRALQRKSGAINWINYDNQSIKQLRSENKPVLIDFYADWCAACKELDHKTFSDKRIVEKSKGFTMVRVDATSPDSKRTHLIRKFKISGLPTVVFMSAKGEELNSLKITGFLKPAEMIRRMEDALGP